MLVYRQSSVARGLSSTPARWFTRPLNCSLTHLSKGARGRYNTTSGGWGAVKENCITADAQLVTTTRVPSLETAAEGPAAAPHTSLKSKLVNAHSASVSALLVLQDAPGEQLVVSASLDSSLASWRLTSSQAHQAGYTTTARPTSCQLHAELGAWREPELRPLVRTHASTHASNHASTHASLHAEPHASALQEVQAREGASLSATEACKQPALNPSQGHPHPQPHPPLTLLSSASRSCPDIAAVSSMAVGGSVATVESVMAVAHAQPWQESRLLGDALTALQLEVLLTNTVSHTSLTPPGLNTPSAPSLHPPRSLLMQQQQHGLQAPPPPRPGALASGAPWEHSRQQQQDGALVGSAQADLPTGHTQTTTGSQAPDGTQLGQLMASQAVAPAQATQAGSAGAAAAAAAALTLTQPLASAAATQLPTLMPHGQGSGPTPCWASSGSYSITPWPHATHSSHVPGHTCACGGPGSGAVQLCSACSSASKVAEEAEGCRWLGGPGPGLAAAGEGLGAATSIQLRSHLTRSAAATSNQFRSRDSSDDDVSGFQGSHTASLNAAHFNSVASNGFHVPAGLGPAPTPTHFNVDLGVTPVPMEMGSVTSCGAGEHEGSEGTCEANEDLEPLTAKHQVQATRLAAPGGPVFSLARQPASPEHDQVQGELLYCGTAAHQLLAWPVTVASSDTASASSTQLRVMAAGYPGCVRALAASGPWLFSVANHCLLLHDTRRGLPSLTHTQEVMKGDILALAAAPNSSAVFVGTAAGGIHGFSVTKSGSLKPLAQVSSAHSAAVTGLAVYGSRLYSVGLDGALQAWSTDDLTLAAQVHDAHLGASMHCITLGPDGLLYTGGDDKLVRRWHPLSAAAEFLDLLEPKAVISPARQRASLLPLQPAGAPLASHCAGVRALATGSRECLVSGDAQGDLCIWTLAPRGTAAATSP